jgi:hypothetical protein
MTHKELVEAAYRWVLKRGGCGVAFKELNTVACNGEYPDVIGFGSWLSVLVECKVSQADFWADKKKSFRINPELGMGKYRYYCCAPGVIGIEKLPERWGLVHVIKGRARCVFNPYGQTLESNIFNNGFPIYNREAEQQLMYSALRRLAIKGHLKHIYDKDYQLNITGADIIQANM